MSPSTARSRSWQSRDDTRRIQALARSRFDRDWPATRFHPGDLDWWVVGTVGRPHAVAELVRLWFTGDQAAAGAEAAAPGAPTADDAPPAAFGWFSPPGDLDYLIESDEPEDITRLLAEIVAWAEGRREALGGREVGPLRVWASTADAAGTAALAALGFELEQKPGFVHFTGELAVADGWPAAVLPEGLAIRPLDPDRDVEARVVCGWAAFPGSTNSVERYRSTFDAWLYRPDLDHVVVTDEGRVVAFALGWYDPALRAVELEPVGVHPEWHGRGLGREICRSTLRAARALGATRAVIAAERSNPAAMGLYASLGLTVTTDILPFIQPPTAVAPVG
ncbi:MAG TPA: GNAT family N-acetyltransferase [Candidatus Limnocylindrales bacterium]|nr:GNAT family N-acetyltransferase [Candidatus Limnocylindrales bacterium]